MLPERDRAARRRRTTLGAPGRADPIDADTGGHGKWTTGFWGRSGWRGGPA
ncbi:hypothetical protein A4R44_09357 [Amycolatopsis sp. M39]|uniref:Uncharacterized protein n=1 Tax=Amycolatopsis rubida TaxID=112413 RepID=A0A1I5I4U0_9PSEU|nr:hypothetical protein A4R44_09357 [Amycolatopsis sp. M39]SFO55614.1 hypothetical protein SAMN05421854_102271 [Amycolatopsis rubida]